jgi:hypothetical protein
MSRIKARAVEHAALDELFEIAFLRRRQRMIEQHHVGVVLGSCDCEFHPPCRLPTKNRGSGRSRRPPMFTTGMAPAERVSASNSWTSSGSAGAPIP